jgi:hypothetical protein
VSGDDRSSLCNSSSQNLAEYTEQLDLSFHEDNIQEKSQSNNLELSISDGNCFIFEKYL